MAANKNILLTIDLEEFDLPLEYGISIPSQRQMNITNQGQSRVVDLLNEYDIKATFFVTSVYAKANPLVIRQIVEKHEIASHSYNHTIYDRSDLEKSKQILEEMSGVRINGFRMPRMAKVDYNELKRCGYTYDSSINPTFIPFRYNYFFKPRTLFADRKTSMSVIPTSVSPVTRFPLFWLSFKNLPFRIYVFLCERTLNKDGYLNLYFHSCEFADIRSFKVPFYMKQPDGNELTDKLEKLLVYLKKKGEFITISEFLRTRDL